MSTELTQFENAFKNALADGSFVKLSVGNYKGTEELKQLKVRRILLKKIPHLSITYRFKTKDEVKNVSFEKGIQLIVDFLLNGFNIATLFSTHKEVRYEVLKNGKSVLEIREISLGPAKDLHNNTKNRLIPSEGNHYLHLLGVSDSHGVVLKSMQDKYKQINHYIELLAPLVANLPQSDHLSVADMGSGKGYLTFALYDYLANACKLNVSVTGIEFRKDLVDFCNNVAVKSAFDGLKFIEGAIDSYNDRSDILIALHACDTATDDAIFKGITADASLIVVAPCCHKQIRKEMVKGSPDAHLSLILKHGILMERQAEMLTDSLRALYLEYMGYKTKVFQFISDAHTPKNVMIVAVKQKQRNDLKHQKYIKDQIDASLKFYGIQQHYLGKLLGI